MLRRDWMGLGVVALTWAATAAYRAAFIEPREWGAACLVAEGAPLACAPRAGLLWLQQHYLLGAAALLLGIAAFITQRFGLCLGAVAVGIVGVENYNATWAMVGLALGGWCWLEGASRPKPAKG